MATLEPTCAAQFLEGEVYQETCQLVPEFLLVWLQVGFICLKARFFFAGKDV